jgi:hypothetical protein
MSDLIQCVSQNHFNLIKYGSCSSLVLKQSDDFEVGKTICLEETTHDGFQLSGLKLVVVIRNIGVSIKGLSKGYVLLTVTPL